MERIKLFMLIFLLAAILAFAQYSGAEYIQFEIYPPHNEPITQMNTVARYRLEANIDGDLFYGFSWQWQPVIWGDGRWPELTQTYMPDRYWLENNVYVNFTYHNMRFFYHRITYHQLHNSNLNGNWTYGNGVGVRYTW